MDITHLGVLELMDPDDSNAIWGRWSKTCNKHRASPPF